jgi:hypothetical protein
MYTTFTLAHPLLVKDINHVAKLSLQHQKQQHQKQLEMVTCCKGQAWPWQENQGKDLALCKPDRSADKISLSWVFMRMIISVCILRLERLASLACST